MWPQNSNQRRVVGAGGAQPLARPGTDALPEHFCPPVHLDAIQLPCNLSRQTLDPSESLVWGRDDARALRWPVPGTAQDDALIAATPTSGCTPLHIAFASRRWEHASQILRDPAPIALLWLRALAVRALQALDKAQATHDQSRHELTKLAKSAAEEVAAAWYVSTGVVARGNRQSQYWQYRPPVVDEDCLGALAAAEDPQALIDVESLWPPGTVVPPGHNVFGSTASLWARRCASLEDHEFAYSLMNVLHIAAANAAPVHLVNAVLRIAGAGPNCPARARCGVRHAMHTGGQSADVPLGSEMQPVHVAIKADGAAELVQLLLQAKGGESEIAL